MHRHMHSIECMCLSRAIPAFALPNSSTIFFFYLSHSLSFIRLSSYISLSFTLSLPHIHIYPLPSFLRSPSPTLPVPDACGGRELAPSPSPLQAFVIVFLPPLTSPMIPLTWSLLLFHRVQRFFSTTIALFVFESLLKRTTRAALDESSWNPRDAWYSCIDVERCDGVFPVQYRSRYSSREACGVRIEIVNRVVQSRSWISCDAPIDVYVRFERNYFYEM